MLGCVRLIQNYTGIILARKYKARPYTLFSNHYYFIAYGMILIKWHKTDWK